MRGHVYLGLFAALIAWSPTAGQFLPGLMGGAMGGGGAGRGGAAGVGAGAGAMGGLFPFFMSCNPNFGGAGQARQSPRPGQPPAPGGRGGMSPNPRAPAGMGGMRGRGQSQGFNMQAFMFGQAIDRPDIPDIPAFPIQGPGGAVTWTGCFCDEIGGWGFGSGECVSFLSGNWRNDQCARWGMCCTCNDMGMWKKR